MTLAVLLAVGVGSWFQPDREYDGGRFCAMPHADVRRLIGKLVHLRGNGRRSSCFVIGNGPFVGGRVIDVSPAVRDDLDMRHAGTIRVRVTE